LSPVKTTRKDIVLRSPLGRPLLMRPTTLPAPLGIAGTVPVAKYASTYGVKLAGGEYIYKGSKHRHWTRKCFFRRRRIWVFFDPSTAEWYFFNKTRDVFVPVALLPVLEPAAPADTPPVDAPEVAPEEAPLEISERSAE
jgi:hypothetical protein